jgi:hypothetical protein
LRAGPFLAHSAPFNWKFVGRVFAHRPTRLANFGNDRTAASEGVGKNFKCHAIVSLIGNRVVLYYYRLNVSPYGRDFSTCIVSTDNGATFEAMPAATNHLFTLANPDPSVNNGSAEDFQPRGITPVMV